jgi:hypothetical protein
MCDVEGMKLIEFCDRNVLEKFNFKYGIDTNGDYNQLSKSGVDYASMSEDILSDLMEFE